MIDDSKLTLTVTQFVEVLNAAFDALGEIVVEGEVEDFKIIHSKWVTFQLRDEQSTVGCFMTVWQYKAQIEDGMKVRARGVARLRNKGFFSFSLSDVQPAGEGALKRAFQLLQAKLEAEGLFAPERKRALPAFPRHVALITSQEAAAYTDFVKILNARQGGLDVSFLHVQVQGEPAPRQLVRALEFANTDLKDVDVIVMVRGGGSLEDLAAFNDERVVRAVAASRTPTIVGVGHERDITLAELAADVRASTPSNAAELLVRSREELAARLQRFETSLRSQMRSSLEQSKQVVAHSMSVLRSRMRETAQRVHNTIRLLHSFSPQETLRRGYSLTQTATGKVVTDAARVSEGVTIQTTLAKGRISSVVSTQYSEHSKQNKEHRTI